MERNVLYTTADEDAAVRSLFPENACEHGHNDNDAEDILFRMEKKKIEPFWAECIRKYDRQIRCRLRRDLSLSRDQPPRLPCHPWYNNCDEHAWEETRRYHQPRVTQKEIEPKNDAQNVDVCYTCTNHRYCTGPVCEARVLTCAHCESEEGPLRVQYNKKMAARTKKLD